MAFNQNKLARSIIQTQGIFNKYVYETDDTIADVSTVGYFAESRFIEQDGPATNGMGWVGGIIECQCSDGYFIGTIGEDGDSLTGATPSGGSIIAALDDGEVPKYDEATNTLVYAGATVDPDTGEWTFDEPITVPPGSVNIGSQSISNAGFAMQWIDSSTDLEYLFISDNVPSDSEEASGNLVRYKLDPEEIFNNQTVDVSVISPKDVDGNVFYVLPNAADGLNSIFTAIINEAGEFDFFIRLNSHDDAPIFQQRVVADSSDAQVNTITGITNAANAVVTFSADHEYVIGDVPVFNEIVGMTEMNLLPGIEVIGTTSNTITLDVDSIAFGTYVSGGVGYKERLFPLANPLLLLGIGTLLYVELRPVEGSQISSRGGDFSGNFIPWLRAFSRPATETVILDETNASSFIGAPGVDTSVIFNSAGLLDGSEDFTFDDSTKTLKFGGAGSPEFIVDCNTGLWTIEYSPECIFYDYEDNQVLEIGATSSFNFLALKGGSNGTLLEVRDESDNTLWQINTTFGTPFVEQIIDTSNGMKVEYSNVADDNENFYEENVFVDLADTYLQYKRGGGSSSLDKRIIWTTGDLDPASYSLSLRVQGEGANGTSTNKDYVELGWDKDANSSAGGYVLRTASAGTGTAYDLDIQESGAGNTNFHTDVNVTNGSTLFAETDAIIGDPTGMTPGAQGDNLVIATQGTNTGLSILTNNNSGALNTDCYIFMGDDTDPTATGFRGDPGSGRVYIRTSNVESWYFRGDGAILRTDAGGSGDSGAIIVMNNDNTRAIRVDNSEDICYQAADNLDTAGTGSHSFEIRNSGGALEAVLSVDNTAVTATRDLNVTGDGGFTGRVDASNLPSQANEGTFTDANNNYSSPDPLSGAITTAARNVVVGEGSGGGLTTEINNTIVGTNSGNLLLGDRNTLIGSFIGDVLETGDHNVIIGESTAINFEDGSDNVIIGDNNTGDTLATGDNNILIGRSADVPAGTTSDFISINNLIYGDKSSAKVRIGGSGALTDDAKLEVSGDAKATGLFDTDTGFFYDDDTGLVLQNLDPVSATATFELELAQSFAEYRKSDQNTNDTGEHRFQYRGTATWSTSLSTGVDGTVAENEFKTNAGTVIRTQTTAVSATFPSDTTVFAVTDTTAARTITIATSDIGNTGKEFIVKDESGTANGTNSITIVGQASEDIDGSASVVIDAPYGSVRMYAKGNKLWTI